MTKGDSWTNSSNGRKYRDCTFCFALSLAVTITLAYLIIGCDKRPIKGCEDSWNFVEQDSIRSSIGDKPLSYYVDSISSLSRFNHYVWWKKNRDSAFNTGLECKIDSLGEIHGNLVIDLLYRQGVDYQGIAGKVIVIQTSRNRFRPLYVQFAELGELYPVSSRIVQVGSNQILCTKSRLGGQMTQYVEKYWTWDEKCDCPCELRFGFSFREVVAPLIGHELETSYIGEFIPDSLFLWSYISLPGDDYRHPSGGVAWLKLNLAACSLQVVESGYDPRASGHPYYMR